MHRLPSASRLRQLCMQALSILLALVVTMNPVLAVINPSLQPCDLLRRYQTALVASVTAIDEQRSTVTLAVRRVVKGAFTETSVTIAVPQDMNQGLLSLRQGQSVIAFVSEKRNEDKVLFYTGRWNTGMRPDAAKPGQWTWATVEDGNNTMAGIFNGAVEQLASLLDDAIDQRDYFPATPDFIRFKDDKVLGTLAKLAGGVALADLDGDGRLDALATSTAGVRVWLQREELRFEDGTAALGLAGVAAMSVAVADVDGDGRSDLLLDGTLWHGTATGFIITTRVPRIAGLITATFQDVDGDGWPDVLAATMTGVQVWLNPGTAGAPFIAATSRLGLDQPACGSGRAALVSAGDWDGDGRCDLFVGLGKGILLVRDAAGVLRPRAHQLDLELTPAPDGQLCGGAAFATLWRPDTISVLVPRHAAFNLLVNEEGKVLNRIGSCNETSEPSDRQLWTLADDLNADGLVDIYTASGSTGSSDVCQLNRGYGSYMRPMKYSGLTFPGAGYATGSWGVAVGDVDGDGALDLLLGCTDGSVRLVLNDSLAQRKQPDESTTIYLARVALAKLLTVAVTGPRGVVGATVSLTDAKGRIVALRRLSGHGVAGSWSGGALPLAVRSSGRHVLTVRYSDGAIVTRELDLTTDAKVVIGREPQAR